VNLRFNVLRLLPLLLILIFLPYPSNQSSSEPPQISMQLTFDKPYFSPSEYFSMTTTILNNSNSPIKRTKLTLTLYREQTPTKPKRVVLEQRFYVPPLDPGKIAQFKLSKKASNLKIGEGAHPVKAILAQRGTILAEKETALVLVDPKPVPPLLVVIIWNLHDRVHYEPNGIFMDQQIQVDCSTNPQNPGIYFQHLSALAQHPNVQVNLNFTPVLVEQILNISDGYKFKKNGKKKAMPETSQEARDAEEILKGYERIIKNKQVELIPAPYAYPALSDVAKRGWNDDGLIQIEKGKEILSEAFNLPPENLKSVYPPDLSLSEDSLYYLARSGAEYSVLDERFLMDIPTVEGDVHKSYRVQDRAGNRLTIFFTDGTATKTLVEFKDEECATQRLIGVLAQTYLKQPEIQQVVVIAPKDRYWRPTQTLLEMLYSKLEQTPWIRTTTLSTAAQLVPPSTQPLILAGGDGEESYIKLNYYRKIEKSREFLNLFSKMVLEDNPLKEKFLNLLLIAQSSDWMEIQRNPQLVNYGLDFAKTLQRRIESELAKMKIPKRQVVTLTSRTGKVPIPIYNDTDYIVRVLIIVRGEDFSFPAGNKKMVSLKPKENLFTFPVIAKTTGSSAIEAAIHVGDKEIEKSTIIVKSTYFTRTFIFILITLLLLGTLLTLLGRFIKLKKKIER